MVALAPHLTELAFAVGAGAALVGVVRYSDYPAEARALPMVGDAFALNFEAIAALKPDLVLLWRSGLNERAKRACAALGCRSTRARSAASRASPTTLRRLGTLLGTEAAAGAAAQRLRARLAERCEAQYAGRAPVRVFCQLWHEPLMTINREHLISEAITACGGVNVFGALPTLTPTVSWEAAVAADPQLIADRRRHQADRRATSRRWQRFARASARCATAASRSSTAT